MKKLKKLTKKQKKAIVKSQNELRAQNPKPQHNHHHDMFCTTSYLQTQSDNKRAKAEFRDEKRQAKSQLLKIARKIIKSRKSDAHKKHEERKLHSTQ